MACIAAEVVAGAQCKLTHGMCLMALAMEDFMCSLRKQSDPAVVHQPMLKLACTTCILMWYPQGTAGWGGIQRCCPGCKPDTGQLLDSGEREAVVMRAVWLNTVQPAGMTST
jgi:hypothetical protein